MKISLTRKEYKKSKSIFDDEKDPNKKFKKWYRYAEKKVSEPNAFTLSTSINNKPSSRMMLLKGIDEDLVFYTNKISRKGKQIKENKYASMVFWWKEINRQVRIEGKLKELPAKEVEKYFSLRPIESQIGALISKQSTKASSYKNIIRDFKIERSNHIKNNTKIVMPKFWTGYKIKPDLFEFWQGGEFRLHQRLEFKRRKNKWIKSVLFP
ncbi:MAG: pyridoxamine 5'-phosphate oxidase [Thermodesulfobacteriota bacterium]|nr:pyridoxamine 5'-phosphate oxidase [Thermodesulfobacteriota bacterium]|tara:strand:- start:1275 stop:1904 length:630 start_codon:yes stop_codon:yes gene_type:complete